MGGTPLTDLRLWAERKVRQSVAWALTARPVPAHVAFIMDGNRRYAEHRGERSAEGHAAGYRRLIAALEWCLDLGVRAVSVYAFSIDNYQRSAEEVATLMRLAEEKLGLMLQVRRRFCRRRCRLAAARSRAHPRCASLPRLAGARRAAPARRPRPRRRRPVARAARRARRRRARRGRDVRARRRDAQPLLLLHRLARGAARARRAAALWCRRRQQRRLSPAKLELCFGQL
jgi:hypothetical protein